MTTMPLFSAEFRSTLGHGKYTNWVLLRDFSADHLLCLLCMIGEFDARAGEIIDLLWRHRSSLAGAERSYHALEAMNLFAHGERFDRHEWARRVGRSSMRLELADLPEPVRAAAGAAIPDAAWDWIMMLAEGYEFGGKDAAGQKIHANISANGAVIHVGPERRRGEETKPSFFPAELAQAIESNARARWAAARVCAEEHVLCLLWLAGEFFARSHSVLRVLDAHRAEAQGAERAIVALRAMCSMVQFRERFDVDELDRRISRGRGNLQFDDLAEPVRAALAAAAPAAQWPFVWMNPEGFQLIGKNAAGASIEASVSHLGEVALR